ncbi:MAG: hypothetical protein PHQ12_11390 [Chthoniobacteraceae bacterium]|nr:hypothetical protein [Chthoniobacteraceae bacterium]
MADPQRIHAKKLVELLGKHRVQLTPRRLGQLADKGLFPKPVLEEYEFLATLLGLIEHYQGLYSQGDGSEKKEKLKLAKVKRQTGEEQLAILRERYVPKEDIGPALRNISLNQRAVLQRKLESELAPKLAGLTTLEISAHMATAVDEICAVFHDGVSGWMEAPAADKNAIVSAKESDPTPIGFRSDSPSL